MKLVFVIFHSVCVMVALVNAKPTMVETFLVAPLVIHKAAQVLGIGNVISVDANARAKVLDNEVGVDLAAGAGGEAAGYHAQADAKILGQKARIHGDIYDGDIIDRKNHEILIDETGRQYSLVPQYVGTQRVLVRKYIDNNKIDVANTNTNVVIRDPTTGLIIRRPQSDLVIRDPKTGLIIRRPESEVVIRDPRTGLIIRRPDTTVTFRDPNTGLIIRRPQTNVVIRQPDTNVVIRRPGIELPSIRLEKPEFTIVRQ